MLSVNSNPLALQLANMINNTNQELQEVAKRVSTGKRVITAADDPSGLGVMTTLKAQDRGWGAVSKNIMSAQSLLDVSASALDQQQEIITKMRDLATQGASNTLSAAQRTAIQSTFAEYQTQLDSIVNKSSLFGQNLVGSAAASVTIQAGINAGDTKTLATAKSDGATLGIDAATIDLTSSANASAAITALDTAVNTVASNQATIGSMQNGFKSSSNLVDTIRENLASAISRIEDADLPKETARLQQLQAKNQLAISMAGIINSLPSMALGLLR